MKTKSSFALRQVAGTWVVLPLGATALEISGMITLNETGVLLWQQLEKGASREQLVDALTAEYEVSGEDALADVDAFIEKLRKIQCIED